MKKYIALLLITFAALSCLGTDIEIKTAMSGAYRGYTATGIATDILRLQNTGTRVFKMRLFELERADSIVTRIRLYRDDFNILLYQITGTDISLHYDTEYYVYPGQSFVVTSDGDFNYFIQYSK